MFKNGPGKRTSAQELRHQILTSAQVNNFGTLLFHGAEVNISIELGVEVNIWCRSPQLGAEVTAVLKLLVPNIDCPLYYRPRDVSDLPQRRGTGNGRRICLSNFEMALNKNLEF